MATRPAKRVTLVGAALLVVSGALTTVAAAPGAAAGCTTLDGSDVTTTYTGTDGKDLFCVTEPGDYVIETGAGNDKVTVTNAEATVDVDLGPGNDTYTGTVSGDAIVDGDTGNDKITTGSGDDTVDGGTGNDKITTGAGDDTADGGSGKDKLTAGPGDDSVSGGGDADKIDAGTGDDVVDYGNASGPVSVNLATGTATGEGADSLKGVEGAIGSSYDDTLQGSSGDNLLEGGDGSDTLSGGSGNDTLDGGDGSDALSGGGGADGMTGGNGNDAFDGTIAEGDTADPGSGATACSSRTTLDLPCSAGAVVESISQTVEPVGNGWRVTVRARALDFDGVGVSRIALTEYRWTTPATNTGTTGNANDGIYLSAVPNLVSGTMQNGVFEAVFDLASAPPSAQMGVRVFTSGFWNRNWGLCSGEGCNDAPTVWPCVGPYVEDLECGFASLAGLRGAIMSLRVVLFGATPPGPPTLLTSNPPSQAPTFLAPGLDVGGGYVLLPVSEPASRPIVLYAFSSSNDPVICTNAGPGPHSYDVLVWVSAGRNNIAYSLSMLLPGQTLTITCP